MSLITLTNKLLKKITFCILVVFFTQSISAQSNQTDTICWYSKQITDGLNWKQAHTNLFDAPQNINVLEINLKKRLVTLVNDEETKYLTSEFASANKAIAAINAGFFDVKNGGSVTYIKVDGSLPSADTTKWKVTENLNGAFIIKKNRKFEIEKAGKYNDYTSNKKYDDVLVTGCLLIDEGKKVELNNSAFVTKRHPRTSLGIVDKNTVLLVTVDGRSEQAAGMSLEELTTFMQFIGCKEAINLDGGGSTTMWIGSDINSVVNNPSDNKQFDHGGERKVANALIVK
ncbi:MAG: hypothetical protein CMO01_16910 [Thalassobius sp.]|nr:hypothetical protein [Thalassovita sp.]